MDAMNNADDYRGDPVKYEQMMEMVSFKRISGLSRQGPLDVITEVGIQNELRVIQL